MTKTSPVAECTRSNNPVRACDPFKYLPAEIVEQVLELVSFPAIITLRQVCLAWNRTVSEFLVSNACAFKHLDFRNYDLDRVTPVVLLDCIRRGKNRTASVLFACQSTRNAHYSALRAFILLYNTFWSESYLSFRNFALETRLKSECSRVGALSFPLPELRSLAIDNLYFVIRQWHDTGIGDTSALDRLEELHISAHALPMLFAYIHTRRAEPLFPNLRVLQCGSDYEARRRLEVPHWLEGEQLSSELVAFPELRELRIGDVPSGGEREQYLDQDCLDIVPSWMPKLEILACRGVNLRPSRYPRREFVHRVDLRRARHLVELDFSYTKMWVLPFIPSTCERLILRGAGVGAVDLSNSLLNGPDVVDADEAKLENISAQYRGLHVLDLSSCGALLTNSALLGILALCSRHTLTTLVLQSCLRLEFGKYLTELMEQITILCPNLEYLTVSKNSSVTDADLDAIAGLARLQFLDISGTSVTDRGLKSFYESSRSRGRKNVVVLATGCPDVCNVDSQEALSSRAM